jgi:anti-sigma regulatory factor (Ser/Thr protein kinase)
LPFHAPRRKSTSSTRRYSTAQPQRQPQRRSTLPTHDGALISAQITVPAHFESFSQIYGHLQDFLQAFEQAAGRSFSSLLGDAVVTAAMEIASNIICHAYHLNDMGDLVMQARAYADRIEVAFCDWGTEFIEPPTRPLPLLDRVEELPESGLGLFLVRQAMDEVHYRRTGEGINQWRLVKWLPQRETQRPSIDS